MLLHVPLSLRKANTTWSESWRTCSGDEVDSTSALCCLKWKLLHLTSQAIWIVVYFCPFVHNYIRSVNCNFTGAWGHTAMRQQFQVIKPNVCGDLTLRWWWPTPSLMKSRNYSVPKSRLWMSAWYWPRPSAGSTMGSPWPTCSATLPWTTRVWERERGSFGRLP